MIKEKLKILENRKAQYEANYKNVKKQLDKLKIVCIKLEGAIAILKEIKEESIKTKTENKNDKK